MAATVPVMRDWVEPYRMRATDLNEQVRDAVRFVLDPPAALVYRATTTNIPSGGAGIPYPWDTSSFDNNAMWAIGTPTRLLINTSGRYILHAKYQFGNYGTGLRTAFLRSNAAGNPASGTLIDTDTLPPVAGANTTIRLQVTRSFAAGDYVELFVAQTSTLTQAIVTGVSGGFLAARWVGV